MLSHPLRRWRCIETEFNQISLFAGIIILTVSQLFPSSVEYTSAVRVGHNDPYECRANDFVLAGHFQQTPSYSTNVGSMLVQRRRRWANIEATLVE